MYPACEAQECAMCVAMNPRSVTSRRTNLSAPFTAKRVDAKIPVAMQACLKVLTPFQDPCSCCLSDTRLQLQPFLNWATLQRQWRPVRETCDLSTQNLCQSGAIHVIVNSTCNWSAKETNGIEVPVKMDSHDVPFAVCSTSCPRCLGTLEIIHLGRISGDASGFRRCVADQERTCLRHETHHCWQNPHCQRDHRHHA